MNIMAKRNNWREISCCTKTNYGCGERSVVGRTVPGLSICMYHCGDDLSIFQGIESSVDEFIGRSVGRSVGRAHLNKAAVGM